MSGTRTWRSAAAGALCAVLLTGAPRGAAAADITMVSWGGAYTRSQMLAFVRPYEAATGRRIEVLDYNGGLRELRSQVRSLNHRWDVVDLELTDALRACRQGLLEPLPATQLAPAADGTPTEDDFIDGSLTECAVGTVVWSTAIAYDPRALPAAPQRIEDFFDLARFPGRRALRRTPKANLEWALLADGVPPERVYAQLATEAGLRRAFAVLDRIKPLTVWWEAGTEAPRLLETGQVVMASAYNGRVHEANVERGAGLEILWDRQVWNIDLLGIPRDNPRRELALDFIRFATRSDRLAEQARHIPYGPVRRSSIKLLDPGARPHLPTTQVNFRTALRIDALWWAEHFDHVNRRFQDWLAQPLHVPRRLPR